MKCVWFFIAIALFALAGCDKLGDAIKSNSYKAPEINDLLLSAESVYPLDTVQAVVIATNPEDDGALSYSWSATKGQFIMPADDDTVYWIAPVSGGDYTITVTVSNAKKSTQSNPKTVTVKSLDKPIVEITAPKDADFIVQQTETKVTASAFHPNKLSRVTLYVGGKWIKDVDYNSDDNYTFTFTPDSSLVGKCSIKVEAEVFNQPDNISADSVEVYIEGIIPGKAEIAQ